MRDLFGHGLNEDPECTHVVHMIPSVFAIGVSAIEPSTKSGDGMGVILDPCSPQEFFFASVTRAQSSRHPFASESRHQLATLEKGATNTLRSGFRFAPAGTLKGSGGRVVESSSNTSREGGSRYFLPSVDTSRESGGEEVGSRSNTSGEVGSRFPFTPWSSVLGESKYSLVVGGQRGNRIELAKTFGSSFSEENSKSHAHDDVTHTMTMTRNGLRAVERCGRVPYDYSEDFRDFVTMAPRLRTEKKLRDFPIVARSLSRIDESASGRR